MRLPALFRRLLIVAAAALAGSGPAWALEPEQINESMVRVIAIYDNGQVSVGSGFVISDGGYVLTNSHVIAPGGVQADRIVVVPAGAPNARPDNQIEARLVRRSGRTDLAVLQARELDRPPVSFARPESTQGLSVYAFGFPLVADLGEMLTAGELVNATSVTQGEVTREPREEALTLGEEADVMLIQHTAQLHSGNSGGPLVDNCSRVVGVNSGGRSLDARMGSVNIAVAASEVFDFLAGDDETASISIRRISGRCEAEWHRDPRVWIAGGAIIALLLAILLVLLLRGNRSRNKDEDDAAPPPAPGAAGGFVARSEGAPGGSRGVVLHGFDHKNRPVRFEFSMRDLESGVIIGRGRDAKGVLTDERVSRNHARVRMRNGQVEIQDLGSRNGTWVRDRQLQPNAGETVNFGERIRLGPIELTVSRM